MSKDCKREVLSLNRGWLFNDKDMSSEAIMAHKSAYIHSKTRSGSGASLPDFDDSGWERVDLPHDFVVRNIPQADLPGYCGCRKRGAAWYRRHFRLDDADRGKNIELIFGAISNSATVFFNGAPVYESGTGYSGFRCDVSPMAEYGDFLNTIAVRVDSSVGEGWWYEGGGIYRDVWLVKRAPQHIATDGIHANPVKNEKGRWIIPFEAEIENTGVAAAKVYASVELVSPDGQVIASQKNEAVCAELFRSTLIRMTIAVPDDVRLWDIDDPVLYSVRVSLFAEDGALLDETEQKCGFRTIRFDSVHGFFLNGRHVKIKGTCNHQDHACVGVAVPKSVERFRLLKLKEMGCNAYRCSHNPPSTTLLDLCDELGILVMDENRHFSTSEEHLDLLRRLVKRDRNHPCVILWSLFNEEPLQSTAIGYEMTRKMRAIVRQYDTTRPTTGAMNGGFLTPCNASHILDVPGINYYIYEYDHFHEIANGKPIISTEDTSAVTTRGATATDEEKHLLADNDTEAVKWGATQRKAWKAIDEREWMCGGFAWTGFDYRGEPTPYPFPSSGSFFGIVDLCGFPKNSFYVRQALWRDDFAVLKIATHWNRPEKPGTAISVLVISSKAETVELFLNGKSLGTQKTDRYDMNTFEVQYEPGELKAVSYASDGSVVAETKEVTTGTPVAIVLEPDRAMIADDGYDMVPVTVYAVDAQGRRVPDAANHIVFEVGGDGVLVGVGNGDENSLESEILPERSLFNGYAQIMLKSRIGGRTAITLTASSDGLKSAETSIAILPDSADRVYADVPRHQVCISDWTRSPLSAEKPDPFVKLDANDMNSWERYEIGTYIFVKQDGLWQNYDKGIFKKEMNDPFVMVRTELPYTEASQKTLIFRNVLGRAEFYFAGRKIAFKESWEPEEFKVELPGFKQEDDRRLTIVLQGDPVGKYCGILGLVLM